MQRLRGDCAHPSHICSGTALAAATSSAPGTALALTESTPGTAAVKARGRGLESGLRGWRVQYSGRVHRGQSTDGLRPRPLPRALPRDSDFRLLGAPVAAGGHRALEAGAASEVGPDATAPGDMHRKSERAARGAGAAHTQRTRSARMHICRADSVCMHMHAGVQPHTQSAHAQLCNRRHGHAKQAHIRSSERSHTRAHAHMRSRTRTCAHTHMHSRTRSHALVHMHTHTRARTRAHAHARMRRHTDV